MKNVYLVPCMEIGYLGNEKLTDDRFSCFCFYRLVFIAGVVPQKRTRSSTEENIYASLGSKVKESPVHSVELEWDNDFVSADTEELISKTTRNDS